MDSQSTETLSTFLDHAYNECQSSLVSSESILDDFIDLNFFDELKTISRRSDVYLCFENTLRKLLCSYRDKEDRKHTIYIEYLGKNQLRITKVDLPPSPYQDCVYSCLETLINEFVKHVNSLSGYFFELDQIDRYCTVVDPVKPTYRDEYRKILLDTRVWLHLQVTADGAAENLHLVGNVESWQDKLQDGIAGWDHDKDIIDNVMRIFDLSQLPGPDPLTEANPLAEAELTCGICLSGGDGDCGVPQPLCPNPLCGVYFHRACLYQWLIACLGGRAPALGVASGACPACQHTVACSADDT